MAGCHIPDSSAQFGAGAVRQPPSHVDRATCLVCHSALAQPALPATHAGRMDPSCSLCHTGNAK